MQQNQTDLISVIIPTRNRSQRLLTAIKSAQLQKNVNLEIIVIDDASTDETKHVVETLKLHDSRIHYRKNATPLGGGGARNLGISISHGRYIAFLDDDDSWDLLKLSKQLAEFVSNSKTAAVSCSFEIQKDGYQKTKIKRINYVENFQQLLLVNSLGGASVCFTTRDNLNLIKGFDSTLESGQDWDLWIKLWGLGEIRVLEDPLVRYVIHADTRITGNPLAAYRGRRSIHLHHKSKMLPSTRIKSINEVQFLRLVIFQQPWLKKTNRLMKIVHSAKGITKLKFLYRFTKHVFE